MYVQWKKRETKIRDQEKNMCLDMIIHLCNKQTNLSYKKKLKII